MGIVDEDVVRVRESTDLTAVVGQYLQLKRVGRRWVGLCPFHAEKTPSFSVNAELGFFKCFGCGLGGDAITFVREIEHLDFVGAVEWLAAKANLTLRYTQRGEDQGRRRRTVLVDAMGRAVEWYHQRLLTGADAGPARAYLRSRGIDGDVARAYRIGWAPNGFDELSRALRLPDDALRDTGLGFLNRRHRQQDAFRARVLFPIHDAQGDPVAFGGRSLPGADGPKYKNSPATPIYAKTKVLYGLNWAKGDIVAADEAIVCEGYTDVIGFAGAGIPRAVATCGTALTDDHLRLLRRFAGRVVLAFDADAAGQAAAEKFYAWEQALDLEVAVAALPEGVDPDDLARSDPERLRSTVAEAVPFLGFRLERVLGGANLSSPEGRARAAEAALAVIREHPSNLVRDQYVMEVADRCRVEPDHLRAGLRRPGAVRVAVDRPPTRVDRDDPEHEVLRHAIHQPAVVAPHLEEILFAGERCAAAFRALAGAATFHEAVETADPGAAELLGRLALEETYSEPDEAVARLVEEAVRRELRRLDAEARQAEDPIAVATDVGRVKLAVEQLWEPASRLGATEHLVAWLRARSEG